MEQLLNLMDWAFGRLRWYRRLCRGHWECWRVSVFRRVDKFHWGYYPNGIFWYQTDGCSARRGKPPYPWCSGIPACEDYGEWMPVDWSD